MGNKCYRCDEKLVGFAGKAVPGYSDRVDQQDVGDAIRYRREKGFSCDTYDYYKYHGSDNYYCDDCYHYRKRMEEERNRQHKEEEDRKERRRKEERRKQMEEERNRHREEEERRRKEQEERKLDETRRRKEEEQRSEQRRQRQEEERRQRQEEERRQRLEEERRRQREEEKRKQRHKEKRRQRQEERRRQRQEERQQKQEERRRQRQDERRRQRQEERRRQRQEERRRQRQEERRRQRQEKEEKRLKENQQKDIARRRRVVKERRRLAREKRIQDARITRQIQESEHDFEKVIGEISKERVENQARETRCSTFMGLDVKLQTTHALAPNLSENKRATTNHIENQLMSLRANPKLDGDEVEMLLYDIGDLLETWYDASALDVPDGNDLHILILRYLTTVYFTKIADLDCELVIEVTCQGLEEVLGSCIRVSEKVEFLYHLYNFVQTSVLDTCSCETFLSNFIHEFLIQNTIASSTTLPEWAMTSLKVLLTISLPAPDKSFDISRAVLDIVHHGTWTIQDVLNIFPTMVDPMSINNSVLHKVLEQIKTRTLTKSSCIDLMKERPNTQFQKLIEMSITEGVKDKDICTLCEELKSNRMLSDNAIDQAKVMLDKVIGQLCLYGYPNKIPEIDLLLAREKIFVELMKTTKPIRTNVAKYDVIVTELLILICCAVRKMENGYWPRATQLLSCIILLKSEENMGRILEIATGEGKSCIIAMFASALALTGISVDIVTSSPVLAKRDAQEWSYFYKSLNLTVSHNINLKVDKKKIACYSSNVVYGTVSSFAADILEHEFEMKNIRADRETSKSAVIVDEVDFMMLDQGVQFTYLNHETLGFRHLDPIISLIWAAVQRFTPFTHKDEVWFCDRFQPIHKTIHDLLQGSSDSPSVKDVFDIAEDYGILKKGLIAKIEKEQDVTKRQEILAQFTPQTMLEVFHLANEHFNIGFELFESTKDGLKKVLENENKKFSILLLDNGYCTTIFRDKKTMELGIASSVLEMISENKQSQIASTQLNETSNDTPKPSKIHLPKFLRSFVEDQLPIWVENAFTALQMTKDRDYLVNGKSIVPVDKSTGVLEHNKKWGDGLQQFVELKHALPMSQISLVTNFMSNLMYFKCYGPRLFGVTGTLGSDTDKKFLHDEFHIDLCGIPTHKSEQRCIHIGRIEENEEKWLSAIQQELEIETQPKPWRQHGRASLIICEDIKTADSVSSYIKNTIKGKLYMYTGISVEKSKLPNILNAEDVIIATNLAGRGSDISVSPEVNSAGGLFVILTYLPSNVRIEKQAFGRTGRKGQPGACKLVLNSQSIPAYCMDYKGSLSGLKNAREVSETERIHLLVSTDLKECKEKEDLFRCYCAHLRNAMERFRDFDQDEKDLAVNTLHEKWGMWLQMKSDKGNLDQVILRTVDNIMRKKYDNPYQIIVQGNSFFKKKEYSMAERYYDQAIQCDETWSCIALYNNAHCKLVRKPRDYIKKAKDDLENALKRLHNYRAEFQQVNASIVISMQSRQDSAPDASNHCLIWKDLDSRNQVLSSFERNMSEAFSKLDHLQKEKKDGKVISRYISHLLDKDDDTQRDQLVRFYKQGLIQIYAVEEKPGFCWSGLAVLCLGLIQVAAGIVLTAVSSGFLASVGSSLISEGISDVFAGIKGIYHGKFDWKAWGVEKAISLSITVCTMGISSIMSKGVKASGSALRTTVKETMRQGTQITKVLGQQWGTQALKGCIKSACKVACKELVKQTALQVANYAEDKVFQKIMDKIEEEVHSGIKTRVIKSAESGKISESIDTVFTNTVTKHIGADNLPDFQGPSWQHKIEDQFLALSQEIIHKNTENSQWVGYARQFTNGVLGGLRHRHKGNKYINIIEKSVKVGAIAKGGYNATQNTKKLIGCFDDNIYMRIHQHYKCEKADVQSMRREIEDILNELKTSIGQKLAKMLSQELRIIWKQKCIDLVTSEIKSAFNRRLSVGLDTLTGMEKTRQELNDQIIVLQTASMTLDVIQNESNVAGKINWEVDSLRHGDDEGNIFHLRMMAEKLRQAIVVKDSEGKVIVNMGNQANATPIILIYNKKGHYDAEVSGNKVCIDNTGKDCLFQAVAAARGVKQEDLRIASGDLKDMCAGELELNRGAWLNVYNRLDQVRSMTSLLAGGAGRPVGPDDKGQIVYGKDIGKRNKVELDHWPPWNSIRKAIEQGGSNLSKEILESARGSDGKLDSQKLLCLIRDKIEHRKCLTTGSSHESKASRKIITDAIKENDFEKTFKTTCIVSDIDFAKDLGRYNGQKQALPRSEKEYKIDCLNVLNGYRERLSENVMSSQTYDSLQKWVIDGGARDKSDVTYIDIKDQIQSYCKKRRSRH